LHDKGSGIIKMAHLLGHIGRKTINSANHILNLFALTFRILKLISKRPKAGRTIVRRAIFEQIYFTCVQALPIIIPIALIVGSMLIIQFTKFSAVYDLGKTTVLLIVRELGPMITAFLVILRSATAVTVEISYMNVLHEIESIEMAGVDPMLVICLPRLVGITSAVFPTDRQGHHGHRYCCRNCQSCLLWVYYHRHQPQSWIQHKKTDHGYPGWNFQGSRRKCRLLSD